MIRESLSEKVILKADLNRRKEQASQAFGERTFQAVGTSTKSEQGSQGLDHPGSYRL